MLYAVYGSEIDKAKGKKNSLVNSFRKQRPDAEFFVVDTDNFSESVLQELCSSQGLFVKKHIVLLDRLLSQKKGKDDKQDNKEEAKDTIKEILVSYFPHMAESESHFIFFNETIDAKTTAVLKKYAKDIFVFGEKKVSKEKDNSTFDIVNAFMTKDRKGAWVNYQKCIKKGIAPEAIHGALFWQIKTSFLAKKTGGWDKAKNYTEDELDEILERLVNLYHLIRTEGGSLELSLEKFLLEK